MKAKLREQLDEACEDENLLSLNAPCHPNESFLIHYDRSTGNLLIHCAKCAKYVDSIAVKAAPK